MNELLHDFSLFLHSGIETYSAYTPCIMTVAGSTTSTQVVSLGKAATWVIEATKKLERLGSLNKGWDSYGGEPLQMEAKEITAFTLNCLKSRHLPTPRVVLGSSGTVQLEWTSGNYELDLDLGTGQKIAYVVTQNDDISEGEIISDYENRLLELTDIISSGR